MLRCCTVSISHLTSILSIIKYRTGVRPENGHKNTTESSLLGYKSVEGIKNTHPFGVLQFVEFTKGYSSPVSGAGISCEDPKGPAMPHIRFYVFVTQILTDIQVTPFGCFLTGFPVRISIAYLGPVRQVFCLPGALKRNRITISDVNPCIRCFRYWKLNCELKLDRRKTRRLTPGRPDDRIKKTEGEDRYDTPCLHVQAERGGRREE